MITIVSATNRKNSTTLKIAKLYQNYLRNLDINSEIIDLSELPQDFIFSALYENNGKHTVFNEYRQKIAAATKIIFIVPEYNASFPGVLKGFIDGLSYPDALSGKKAALVGLSAGVLGNAWGLNHLTDIFHYLNMEVLSIKVRLASIKSHFVNGEITNDLYNALITMQLEKFLKF
jgi:NAD(P)H-dependent FMN reductase